MGSEVYVLVFDPQDANSRSAFTKAQWMASGRISGSESVSDRLPVRAGESDATRQPGAATRDTDLSRTDPSRLEGSKTDSTVSDPGKSYSSTHSMGGKQVKVTGKVLQKGGIKAIEVASIEDATMPAATSPSGLRTTPPNN
jgi:hypothetical protein